MSPRDCERPEAAGHSDLNLSHTLVPSSEEAGMDRQMLQIATGIPILGTDPRPQVSLKEWARVMSLGDREVAIWLTQNVPREAETRVHVGDSWTRKVTTATDLQD